MNHLTHFVYRYPSDAKYSPVPNDTEGGAIEDYGCQLSIYPVAVGDSHTAPWHRWEGDECRVEPRRWHVAEVVRYEPIDAVVSFSVAILTFDGEPIAAESPGGDVLEIAVMPEKFKLTWPETAEHCAGVGDAIYRSDYQVDRVSVFTSPQGYEQVRVLWCVPAAETVLEEFAIA